MLNTIFPNTLTPFIIALSLISIISSIAISLRLHPTQKLASIIITITICLGILSYLVNENTIVTIDGDRSQLYLEPIYCEDLRLNIEEIKKSKRNPKRTEYERIISSNECKTNKNLTAILIILINSLFVFGFVLTLSIICKLIFASFQGSFIRYESTLKDEPISNNCDLPEEIGELTSNEENSDLESYTEEPDTSGNASEQPSANLYDNWQKFNLQQEDSEYKKLLQEICKNFKNNPEGNTFPVVGQELLNFFQEQTSTDSTFENIDEAFRNGFISKSALPFAPVLFESVQKICSQGLHPKNAARVFLWLAVYLKTDLKIIVNKFTLRILKNQKLEHKAFFGEKFYFALEIQAANKDKKST